MASILSVATAVPPERVPQDRAKTLAGAHFRGKISNLAKYLTVFDHSLVEERAFCLTPEALLAVSGLGEANRLYVEWAERLAAEAARCCLSRARADPGEVGTVVFVSSTGIATPSLDVALIDSLGLRPDVRRVPVFGLGCAGGAAGLAIAARLADGGTGHPAPDGVAARESGPRTPAKVLLIAVELNSLTFQHGDYTKSNLVATSLFADGAAAALVSGGEGPVEIVESATYLVPRSRGLMGWEFVDSGFRVVFSRRIPKVIQDMIPETLGRLLGPRSLDAGTLASLVLHPGGRKILEAYESALGVGREHLAASYRVLARYGNMSSATVLFVLDEEMRASERKGGDLGLLAAFGPGFSSEISLLRWT
jgi:alkylresorcinol/alkylpyrone synthase